MRWALYQFALFEMGVVRPRWKSLVEKKERYEKKKEKKKRICICWAQLCAFWALFFPSYFRHFEWSKFYERNTCRILKRDEIRAIFSRVQRRIFQQFLYCHQLEQFHVVFFRSLFFSIYRQKPLTRTAAPIGWGKKEHGRLAKKVKRNRLRILSVPADARHTQTWLAVVRTQSEVTIRPIRQFIIYLFFQVDKKVSRQFHFENYAILSSYFFSLTFFFGIPSFFVHVITLYFSCLSLGIMYRHHPLRFSPSTSSSSLTFLE